MHYAALLNEPKMWNEELQTLIYEQCYSYIRATTPVSQVSLLLLLFLSFTLTQSQHPAIYYAHIVSNRAIPHDPKWSGSSDGTPTAAGGAQSGSQSGGKSGGGSSSGLPSECEKLMVSMFEYRKTSLAHADTTTLSHSQCPTREES